MTKHHYLMILTFLVLGLMQSCTSDNKTEETEIATVGTETTQTLEIKGNGIWVRSEPTTGDVIIKLNEGDKCHVLEKGKQETINNITDCWYKIKYQEKIGWVFGSQTTMAVQKIEEETTTIEDVAANIIEIVASGKYNKLNEYVVENEGLYKFHNPGVFVAATPINKIEDDLLYDQQKINTKVVKTEEIATYDCENGWNKEGIFLSEVKNFDQLSKVIKEEEMYLNAKPSKAAVEKAQLLEKQFEKLIQFTELNMNIYLYRSNNKWYIGLIDLTTPCDA